jgi:chromosome segregation ATPase
MTQDAPPVSGNTPDQRTPEELERKLAALEKQQSAQRSAFDQRGRRLIGLQNANFRLHDEVEAQRQARRPETLQARLAQAQNEHAAERDARFRETEILTRALMEAEERLGNTQGQVEKHKDKIRKRKDRSLKGRLKKLFGKWKRS